MKKKVKKRVNSLNLCIKCVSRGKCTDTVLDQLTGRPITVPKWGTVVQCMSFKYKKW
jgi:hypothetical protein